MVLEINSPLSHDKAIAEMPSINSESKAPDPEAIKLPTSKKRAVRNSTIIGASYFLYFAGFWSLSALQSTMNSEGGMGVDSQAVIYLCSMLSCFFPELLIEKFGTKTTYVVALSLSLPYIAANFSLRWDTLIISSVLYGLASGPYNAALSCYNDEMSSRYAKASNEKRENVEATFFGLFMFFGEFCQVVGNLIAYYALIGGRQPPSQNFTVQTECGINFDPSAYNGTNTNLDPPSDRDRYILIGAYLLLGVLAVALSLLLDPLGNDVKEVKGCRSVSQRVISAVKHLKKPHQLLLLPLTVFIGMEGSFYAADVTEAFIACSWGVHHVGFVTICFGVCGALMSILVGPLVKCTNQLCVILFAALVNIVTFAMLFFWVPKPDHPVTYFIFAGVWGMTDAIWWSQIAALYGLMFPQDREAAFSNFFFWSFLGYFLSYSYANYFNVAVKINIMMTFLIVGITLYLIGQVKIKCCSHRNAYVEIGQDE